MLDLDCDRKSWAGEMRRAKILSDHRQLQVIVLGQRCSICSSKQVGLATSTLRPTGRK